MPDCAGDPGTPRRAAIPMTPKGRRRWRRLKGPAIFALVGLAVIWGLVPLMPASWGVRVGMPYQVFFSLAVVGSAAFFVLLNWGPLPLPASPLATFASIFLVYLATVGGVMSFGLWYYPQFEAPRAVRGEARAQARGKEVFLSLAANCFACHSIAGLGIRGGSRGPDLSAVGSLAAARRPGLSAAAYLRQSIVDPAACLAPLPASGLVACLTTVDAGRAYPPLMPPGFGERLGEQQVGDLVAFLVGLKGGEVRNGENP